MDEANELIGAKDCDAECLKKRVDHLEKQVIANAALIRSSRVNQRRSDLVLWAIVGLEAAVLFGVSYQNGSLSYAIPAELAIAVVAAAPVIYGAIKGKTDSNVDKRVLENPLQPPYE